jgi:hypothetical protein
MAGSYRSANATVAAHSAFVVTPSDATIIPATRGLYIGGAGNINVVMAEDENTVLFTAVPAGFILPIQVIQVLSTSTTATAIVALN